MNMKLSHHSYRSSLIGILSASVLLSLSAGNVLADANTGQPASHLTTAKSHDHGQVTTKEVTRTINYVDPLTKEKHTINQVVRFQFDQDGKLIKKGTVPAWQAYFVPYFEGYAPNWCEVPPKVITPNSANETEDVIYTKVLSENPIGSVLIKFIPIDGSNVQYLTIGNSDGKPLSTFELPEPPEGWKYVGKDQLPKIVQITPGATRFNFLIQRNDTDPHQEKKQENKELSRKIILHLPTGDKVITQHARATRDVSVVDGKTSYGEWQISPFDEFVLPQVDGYQSSLTKVASLQLTADQLEKEPVTIKVDYHKVNDEGTSTDPSEDASTEIDPVPGVDEGTQTAPSISTGTQTDPPAMSDAGTQTEPSTSKDEGTQTDQPTKEDEGNQTDDTPTVDTGVGDDTITGTDEGTQIEQPTKNDEGSQAIDTPTTNIGVGDDSIAGTDESTQTDQPTKSDEGSQTIDTPTTDTGVGDDSITGTDQGTQTETVPGKDDGTQTEQPAKADEGSQTIDTPTTDTGVGDDSIAGTDQGTQTDQPTGTDEGSQTNDTPTTNTGVGDDSIKETDQGTQTEPSTNEDQSTQTGTTKGDQGASAVPDQTSTQPTIQEKAKGQDAIDPVAFHNELNQLQRPLKELATSPQHHQAAVLPQTGNQTNLKVFLTGILTVLTGALLAMFHLQKRH